MSGTPSPTPSAADRHLDDAACLRFDAEALALKAERLMLGIIDHLREQDAALRATRDAIPRRRSPSVTREAA